MCIIIISEQRVTESDSQAFLSMYKELKEKPCAQVAMMRLDQEQRGSAPYHTSSRGIPPPLVTTNFTVVDDGE